MKKTIFWTILFVGVALFVSCDTEEMITESELPTLSKEFLKTHFESVKITYIVKETEGLDKDYTVYLANGFDIDFTKSGAWNDVDGHVNSLPQSILNLLPIGILQYIAANFPDYKMVEVNKERYGYEIGLNDDIDLEFNSKGEFLRID